MVAVDNLREMALKVLVRNSWTFNYLLRASMHPLSCWCSPVALNQLPYFCTPVLNKQTMELYLYNYNTKMYII